MEAKLYASEVAKVIIGDILEDEFVPECLDPWVTTMGE